MRERRAMKCELLAQAASAVRLDAEALRWVGLHGGSGRREGSLMYTHMGLDDATCVMNERTYVTSAARNE